MHSKDLITLQDLEGYIDITDIMAMDIHEYDSPSISRFFSTDDNVRIFWKAYEPSSLTHFGEVLASHLARQFGLRSSKYFFAKYKNVKGIISKDYKKEGETELCGRDFLIDYYKETHSDHEQFLKHEEYNNIQFIHKALKHAVVTNKMSKNDATSILENLLKTIMFDVAICNADRHHKNWGVLTKDSRARFIPVFDNGRCFHFYQRVDVLRSWFKDYELSPTKANFAKAEKKLKKQNEIATLSLNITTEDKKYGGFGEPYLKTLEQFKDMFPAFFNKQLENFYQLNFTKAFRSVEEETGVKMPGLVKTVAMTAYEIRYNEISKHFGMVKDDMPEDENLQF